MNLATGDEMCAHRKEPCPDCICERAPDSHPAVQEERWEIKRKRGRTRYHGEEAVVGPYTDWLEVVPAQRLREVEGVLRDVEQWAMLTPGDPAGPDYQRLLDRVQTALSTPSEEEAST